MKGQSTSTNNITPSIACSANTGHDLRTVVPLPEPTNQSQSHVQSQILPRPLSQHHLIDSIHIPQ